MNKILFYMFISFSYIFSLNIANAACLDGVTKATLIHSKIRGFFIRPAGDTVKQYVILDKATCTATGVDVDITSDTATAYYLGFDDADKFMQSSLLTSYAKGDLVEFRLLPNNASLYNDIAYIIVPSGARIQ